MAFRRQFGQGSGGVTPPAETRDEGHASPGLKRVLSRLNRDERSSVLDLGPMCGDSIVALAERGARVFVEEFEPPPPRPPRKPGEDPPPTAPLRIEQPDDRFDLVLAWEQIDFVPGDRLDEFGAELKRVLKFGGGLLLYSHMKPANEMEAAARYRVLGVDKIAREETTGARRRRYTHSTRDIERCLSGFSIQGLQLQRNQLREFAALKARPRVKQEESEPA